MAIGWLAILKSVPWAEVVSNAPLVAEGARKLWKATVRRSAAPAIDPAAGEAAAPPGGSAVLAARVAALEMAIADLQSQMVASSEVIKALADQNTQLVHRVETMRIRLRWLAGVLAALGVLVVAGLLPALLR